MNTQGFDLSAALEDAEGRELVDAIIARKKGRNARDRTMQQMIFGDVLTDGHGNVIPRHLPAYWEEIKDVWERHVDATVTHIQSLNRPAVTELRSAGISRTWTDEMADWRVGAYMEAFHPRLLVGGRGYGKRAAQAAAQRRWKARTSVPHEAPPIRSVRWACKPPTAPVYAPGSNGWMMEQAAARISPAKREHNRKLQERLDSKMNLLYDILGVKPHGTND